MVLIQTLWDDPNQDITNAILKKNFTVRNALGEWKSLIDGYNDIIEWQHIVNLYQFQKTHRFTLANKLTKQHVMFEKKKMKVKLAVQALSKSVANSLPTMCELKIAQFHNVQYMLL